MKHDCFRSNEQHGSPVFTLIGYGMTHTFHYPHRQAPEGEAEPHALSRLMQEPVLSQRLQSASHWELHVFALPDHNLVPCPSCAAILHEDYNVTYVHTYMVEPREQRRTHVFSHSLRLPIGSVEWAQLQSENDALPAILPGETARYPLKQELEMPPRWSGIPHTRGDGWYCEGVQRMEALALGLSYVRPHQRHPYWTQVFYYGRGRRNIIDNDPRIVEMLNHLRANYRYTLGHLTDEQLQEEVLTMVPWSSMRALCEHAPTITLAHREYEAYVREHGSDTTQVRSVLGIIMSGATLRELCSLLRDLTPDYTVPESLQRLLNGDEEDGDDVDDGDRIEWVQDGDYTTGGDEEQVFIQL